MNLTAALAVAAIFELVLHRLVGRLFLPLRPDTSAAQVVSEIGRFAFHLGGVLALILLVSALWGLFRRQELYPRPIRFAVAIVALFLAALSAVGILLTPLPDQLLVHLGTSHAFLIWFTVMALWRVPGSTRTKLAVTFFSLPAVLHAAALFAGNAGWARPFSAELARAAEICALLAGALAPVLIGFKPGGGLRRAAGIGAGVLALATFAVALASSFDLVQTIALYGFGLDLPALSSGAAVIYVALVGAALVGLVTATMWSLGQPGPARLFGYGLVLLAASGYQAVGPHQVLFATCGLLAMATGAARLGQTSEPAPTPVAASAA